MPDFLRSLYHAVRSLMKSPQFFVFATLTLALGIGANALVFGIVNTVMLRPLPYGNAERVVVVWNQTPDGRSLPLSEPEFFQFQQQSERFEALAAVAGVPFTLTSGDGNAERLQGQLATGEAFSVLGVEAVLGRTFLPEDDQPGQEPVVVLSDRIWQRRFGGDPGIIGQLVTIDGVQRTVVGVLAPDFEIIGAVIDLWMPLVLDIANMTDEQAGVHNKLVLGRLQVGVSEQQAQTELQAIGEQMTTLYPEHFSGGAHQMLVEDIHTFHFGAFRTPFIVLSSAVAFLLLIACGNVANLILGRAQVRAKDVAIRSALGAGRARLIRYFLTESIVLAFCGGVLGLLLTHWGLRLVVALNPANLPRLETASIDTTVFGASLGVTLLTSLLFGLLPALKGSRIDVQSALKLGPRGASAGAEQALSQKILAGVQTALALSLLVGVSLLIKNFWSLQRVDLGFNPDQVVTARLSLPRVLYPEAASVDDFWEQLLTRVEGLPGVKNASAVSRTPLVGRNNWTFDIEGRLDETFRLAQYRFVRAGYFRTLEIPLVRGEVFDQRNPSKNRETVVINQAMKRQYWEEEDPIGQRIRFRDDSPWFTVVGLVDDAKNDGLDSSTEPEIYLYHAELDFRRIARSMTLVFRADGATESLISSLRREVAQIDPNLAVYEASSLTSQLDGHIAQPRFLMVMMMIFGVVALVLTMTGVYGVVMYIVNRRMHEIGVRVALGATRGDILNLVLRQGLLVVGVGMIAGLFGSVLLGRLMASLLFGAQVVDPLILGLAITVIVVAVLLASLIPASRATAIDPLLVLRQE